MTRAITSRVIATRGQSVGLYYRAFHTSRVFKRRSALTEFKIAVDFVVDADTLECLTAGAPSGAHLNIRGALITD